MSCFAFRVENGHARRVDVGDARDRTTCTFTWIHLGTLDDRTGADLDTLGGIPDVARAALLAAETRPRLETIGDGVLVNMRGMSTAPENDPDSLVSIRLWAERARVVTVSKRPLAALPALCDRVAADKVLDPGDLIAVLATEITNMLDPEVATLGDQLDDCEGALDVSRAYGMRKQIAEARARAIDYRRFVVPQRQALERMSQLEVDWLEDEDRLHLREAADRAARMGEELEAIRERAALLHEQITDLRAELIDSRGLLLSIVALVFLPLTFLTGLLGMNVEGIPFAHEPWAFAAVCGACVVIAAAISGYFVAAHWLRR